MEFLVMGFCRLNGKQEISIMVGDWNFMVQALRTKCMYEGFTYVYLMEHIYTLLLKPSSGHIIFLVKYIWIFHQTCYGYNTHKNVFDDGCKLLMLCNQSTDHEQCSIIGIFTLLIFFWFTTTLSLNYMNIK